MSENRKQKRRARKRGGIVLLLVLVAALVVVVYLLFSGTFSGGDGDGAPERDGGGSVRDAAAGDDDGGGDGDAYGGAEGGDDGITSLWYYDAANADRYKAYSVRMPHLPMDDIVWMVEANLDKEPYVDVEEVLSPYSVTLLANKYFYFSESYVPPELVAVGNSMLRADAADAMREMIDDAAAEGHNLWVQSGYRSFDLQNRLYTGYSAADGVEVADTYSARPGYSEHQSGLSVDFNTITQAFGETPEGIWAAENAWKYGFILRYTEENSHITLYMSEPWHFRFIGREAAAEMHTLGFPPYEEYWVKNVKFVRNVTASAGGDGDRPAVG
ncbi:MAG: M15 family metallopeptidase [Clostridiales bacterium]|nr:M15 family metallopeptidase [Clostridiales bacterium]